MASIPVAKRCLRRRWSFFNHHHASASFMNEQICNYGTKHDYRIICGTLRHAGNNHHPWIVAASGRRWKSDDSKSSLFPNIHSDSPFDILGVPKNSMYETVKRRFLELAMDTHPDVVNHQKQQSSAEDDADNGAASEDRKRRAERFIKLRQAFETIRKNSVGSTRLEVDSGSSSSWSDESFQAWFHNETGHCDVMFTMDLQTRKEVAEAASQAQGGLDKGGMWEMARAMAEQEKNMGNLHKKHAGNQSQRVEAGSDDSGSQRQRRRRK